MMKKYCKILSLVLSLILAINLLEIPAYANEVDSFEVINSDETGTDELEDENEPNEEGQNIPVVTEEDETGDKTRVEEDSLVEEKKESNLKEYISGLTFERVDNSTIKVSWNIQEDGFTGYTISVCSDEEMNTRVIEDIEIDSSDTKTYDITDLESGIQYYISVTPYVKNGEGDSVEEGVALKGSAILLNSPVVTATPGDAQVKLSWGKVSGATSYEIYEENSKKVVATVTGVSYTRTGLKNNVTYKYKVRAIAKIDNTTFASDWSETVSKVTKITTPGQVSGLTITPANKAAKLSWKKASGATSYYVYRYDTSTKKWTKIKTTTSTSYTNGSLKVGRKYSYRIYAVRTSGGVTVTGKVSSTVSLTAKEYLTGAVRNMYYKGKIKKKTSAYASSTGKKKIKTIKKGTSVTILSKSNKRCKVKLSNGKIYWVPYSAVRYTGCIYTTKDYTTADKTDFVNKKGYSSKTNYLIWISKYTQRVNIYKGSKGKWKLIRTCRVATGTHINRSPEGVHKITYKEKGWYYSTTYVKNVVHWSGKNSFHSRIYKYNGKLSSPAIGRPASHGCIRMYMEDINYIYKNMPIGTTVVSY